MKRAESAVPVLDTATTNALRGYLERVTQPVELVASLDASPRSQELRELLQETAALSANVSLRLAEGAELDARTPSFRIVRTGTDVEVAFAGLPMGHEFTSYVLALLQVGGNPVKADDTVLDQVRALPGGRRFEVFFSQSCQNCPDVVQALNAMSVVNPGIDVVSIDGAAFPGEAEERGVLAVPTVFLDGEVFGSGRMTLEEIVGRLDSGAADRAAAAMSGKGTYDVLVVGGGPAGAAAAIYAARKGIRTGLAALRFGGQVLDTMAIENFVSVQHTEGPQLATALEAHVSAYDVDVMTLQEAVELTPSLDEGGEHQVRFANGATLSARTVVLATGARWRTMGVPGEDAYRNRGVTFCPHCDGPLFAGKRVAVIGGGNSGVEAAIDLAGVVAHVTLLEFDAALRADEVLQRKLRSLPNVDVVTSALTTEVLGDGAKVVGLRYEDRTTGDEHVLDLEGVFVQIGLLPSTEWLKGVVDLSPRGEIVIDDRGQTSVPGVFAAGDCTTVPYKQIVIALGAGATASLSAFDHLIRTTAPA
jgi:alkyl hydroperoxide reductase subunit F